MAEKIAEPVDAARLAKSGRTPHAHLQIADERFPADQKFIGKREPGTDDETSLHNQSPKEGLFFRSNFQVILHRDELPVHLVKGQASRFQFMQNLIKHAYQLGPEILKGQIPLAIPVGTKDWMGAGMFG